MITTRIFSLFFMLVWAMFAQEQTTAEYQISAELPTVSHIAKAYACDSSAWMGKNPAVWVSCVTPDQYNKLGVGAKVLVSSRAVAACENKRAKKIIPATQSDNEVPLKLEPVQLAVPNFTPANFTVTLSSVNTSYDVMVLLLLSYTGFVIFCTLFGPKIVRRQWETCLNYIFHKRDSLLGLTAPQKDPLDENAHSENRPEPHISYVSTGIIELVQERIHKQCKPYGLPPRHIIYPDDRRPDRVYIYCKSEEISQRDFEFFDFHLRQSVNKSQWTISGSHLAKKLEGEDILCHMWVVSGVSRHEEPASHLVGAVITS